MSRDLGAQVVAVGATTGSTGGAHAAPAGVVAATLQDLEDGVKSIEDQLQAKTVSMGGLIFKSQTLTKAWLGLNAPAAGAFIYFIDAHYLLSLAADEAGSARSVINFQHSAAKGG
jgi:hypothetical protein